ncbi:hypothetical protein AVEN_50300-1 [Araneus ventricosus]|uniref:Uncharacterized protein n=1 Tax=Araneus ventricosus TaxID=182803 RepID=A0A4Y2NPN8_ARAVE|nr:hypothetical protein AVEN_50300-1 [Araneus ventricosus]
MNQYGFFCTHFGRSGVPFLKTHYQHADLLTDYNLCGLRQNLHIYDLPSTQAYYGANTYLEVASGLPGSITTHSMSVLFTATTSLSAAFCLDHILRCGIYSSADLVRMNSCETGVI